ncbi:hypothetical protein BDW22DRAFT_1468809, partial [Trametopsis cervina]
HGPVYYDKDKRYSVNAQIGVLLHNLLIVDYGIGFPGSAHDSVAFQKTMLNQHPEHFLSENEWLWTDSTYNPLTQCCAPFKAMPN